jgi:agmatinase
VSLKLDYLPAEESFLDPVRADAGDPASARAVVIPFGLEASVSYGGGTAAGPAAILAASQQLELYDDELEREPYLDYGVAALREPVIARPIEAALDQLQDLVDAVLDGGRFPFVL